MTPIASDSRDVYRGACRKAIAVSAAGAGQTQTRETYMLRMRFTASAPAVSAILALAFLMTWLTAPVAAQSLAVTGTVTEIRPTPVNPTDALGIRAGDTFTFTFSFPPGTCNSSYDGCSATSRAPFVGRVGPVDVGFNWNSSYCQAFPHECGYYVTAAPQTAWWGPPGDLLSIDSAGGGFITNSGLPVQVRIQPAAHNWFGPLPFPFPPTSIPATLERDYFSMTSSEGIGFSITGRINCFQNCIPELTIRTDALQPARSLDPYAPVQLEAVGGAPPYTWTAVGLPPVLPGVATTLGSAFHLTGDGGLFSTGSLPTPAGAYPITFTVRDSRGATASRTLTLNVAPAPLRYLHRYYNIDREAADHLYTTDFQELGCGRNGWFYEGTIGLLAPSPGPGRLELLRYWSQATGDHAYVTDPAQLPHIGYLFEGSIGYLFSDQQPGTIPLYHLYSASEGDSFYTTDVNEHPTSYQFVDRIGFVIDPPPYQSGCGDLHDDWVRYSIWHSFERGRELAANISTGTPSLSAVVYHALLYAVGTRSRFPTNEVLRDAEYYLFGFRASFNLRPIQTIGQPILLSLYNLAKMAAAGLQVQNELNALLQTLGQAGADPNSPPGGLIWNAKGLLSGLAGRISGNLPAEPLVPQPNQPNSFTRSVQFPVDQDGSGTVKPIYVDPPLNSRVEWTIQSDSGTSLTSIVVPSGTLPAGASLRVVVGANSYALVEDQPFEFARDAGLTNVRAFAIDAAGVTSGDAHDYTLGLIFTTEAAFVWLQQTTILALSLPDPIVINATASSGMVINYDATASSSTGAASVTCIPASGTSFSLGTTLVSCAAADQAGNVITGSFSVTLRATPEVSWSAPDAIVQGTPLSSVQLNATANVPGTFAYTPPLGTLLAVGAGQTLSVIFMPTDSAHYTTAQMQVTIDVLAAGPPTPATFHAIGDLPGGAVVSDVRDATKVGGVLYAVGASASHNQVLCISFNNPVGCVMQYNPDTALMWTFDGGTSTLTPLPDLVTPTGTPVNPLFASAITRDAAHIASQARSNAADPAQMHAVRVTRPGLVNLDLSAAPFPANNQPAAGQAISEDGSIVYGVEGVPFRARRFDVNASTSVQIPLLSGGTSSFIAARGVSFDGSVMVGTSFVFPFTGTNGRAFRYVHSSPVGTASAIPLLAGGTWNKALAVSPDGRTTLVAGNSRFLPNGEVYLYDAVVGTTTALGSPNTPWAPVSAFASNTFLVVNFAGMTADGSVVAASFADPTGNGPIRSGHGYIRNARGWFHFTTILGAQGIDLQNAGWGNIQINGISPDGTLVFGSGKHDGNVEGFVAEFSPGYLASFDVPRVPQTDTSIVGMWTNNGHGGDAGVFLADGNYFHIDTRHGTQTPSEYSSGFERGRYHWKANTGAFSFATLQDTNGSVGLSAGNGSIGLTAAVSGDTLDIANGGLVLSRAVATPGSLVGGWVFGDPTIDDGGGIVAFFPDGTFIFAEDGSSAADPSGHDGVEGGTYTWNPNTGAFTANVTIDTNGGWGFSNGPGSISRTFVLSQDELRLGFPGDRRQLLRIADPQAVVPVISSALSTAATAGYPFAYQIAATRAPSSFSAAGLPPGVGIDTATGLISGTPAQAGIFNVTISASNTLSTGSALLRLAVISPLTTPVGNNVVIMPSATPGAEPVPVTIHFETVTQSGVTAIATIDPATVSAAQHLPSGFSLGSPPVYYEIQTTAVFSGPVTVCFNYTGSSLSGFPRLLHYEAALASWVDITTSVDPSSSMVCGLTSSFSPFAIAASALAGVGFHAPVSPIAGALNAVKGGSTVPLKFNVYAKGPFEITNAEAITNLSFTVVPIACTGGAVEEVIPLTTTGSTSLRYDTSAQQFVQNWKTPKTPGCYLVRVTGDGLLLSAKFKVN